LAPRRHYTGARGCAGWRALCTFDRSKSSIEEVGRATAGDKWFQLYVVERKLAQQMVERGGCGQLFYSAKALLSGRAGDVWELVTENL
jgi:hypothetical protein